MIGKLINQYQLIKLVNWYQSIDDQLAQDLETDIMHTTCSIVCHF